MNETYLLPHRWFAPREDMTARAAAPVDAPFGAMDKIFQQMFNGMVAPWDAMNEFMPLWKHQQAEGALLPSLDVTSDDKAYTLAVELPGVEPDAVKLEVRDNVLVISGEKKQENKDEKSNAHVLERMYGSFRRVLALPDDADVAGIEANHKNGVLSVRIPRKIPEKEQVRSIEIKTA